MSRRLDDICLIRDMAKALKNLSFNDFINPITREAAYVANHVDMEQAAWFDKAAVRSEQTRRRLVKDGILKHT